MHGMPRIAERGNQYGDSFARYTVDWRARRGWLSGPAWRPARDLARKIGKPLADYLANLGNIWKTGYITVWCSRLPLTLRPIDAIDRTLHARPIGRRLRSLARTIGSARLLHASRRVIFWLFRSLVVFVHNLCELWWRRQKKNVTCAATPSPCS
jgi:hypothetical protein